MRTKRRPRPEWADLVRRHQDEFDAFVIACHGDPNIDLMKEITTKPVVGNRGGPR
jgi:allantoin racemase